MAAGEMDDPQPLPEPSTASSASSADVYPEEHKRPGDCFFSCGGGDTLGLRQWLGAALTVLFGIGFAVGETKTDLPEAQYRTLAVTSVVATLWICEVLPIPITGMLVGPLLYLSGVCSFEDALSPYMSNLTLVLFGSSMIALAMERHGLDFRFADAVASCRWVGKSPTRLRGAIMVAGCLLSMWITNTGATYILTPIVMRSMGATRGRPLHSQRAQQTLTGSLLSVAYACNCGGMGTMVGTPSNLVVTRYLAEEGVHIGFVSWLTFGVPAALLVTTVCYGSLFLCYRPQTAANVEVLHSSHPVAWTRGEKAVLGSFLLTLGLWIIPSIYSLAGGPGHQELESKLKAGISVILGTVPLYLIPDTGNCRVMPWSTAQKADWGIIMLIGGGVVLGKRMLSTGLADTIAAYLIAVTGITSVWLLALVGILCTIFLTEVTSNTATTSLMVPMIMAISKAINPDPRLAAAPAVGVALAASCAFMLPIATPPNYIIVETGHVDMGSMAKVGVLTNVLAAFALWIVLRLFLPLVV
ncbi:sdcS [Symbiodinium sp. CCMP2592]|nr:sdcS [Symbiodinium sp. CCMP2592]